MAVPTVFGTALHMSAADEAVVSSLLADLFPAFDSDEEFGDEPNSFGVDFKPILEAQVTIEREMDCSQLFDAYSKSISGSYMDR